MVEDKSPIIPVEAPWRLDWQPKHIERFWDWMAQGLTGPAEVYFSETVGDAVLDAVASKIKLAGVAVDLGAARGFLVNKLLQRGVKVIAVDPSPASVSSIEAMSAGRPGFLGARLGGVEAIPVEDGSADIVFLLEVVEHLDNRVLFPLLPELSRVLKPGGHVVITTPNQERLADNETICPNCGCLFHSMQHVRSWSAQSLKQVMSEAGFVTVESSATLFSRFRSRFGGMLQRANIRFRKRNLPHLLYIGQKPSNDRQ